MGSESTQKLPPNLPEQSRKVMCMLYTVTRVLLGGVGRGLPRGTRKIVFCQKYASFHFFHSVANVLFFFQGFETCQTPTFFYFFENKF